MKLVNKHPFTKNYLENIDNNYGLEVTRKLLTFKSHPTLGFRTAGSQAELCAGDYLYNEMLALGLENVEKSPITVDAWEFKKANLIYMDKDGSKKELILNTYPCQFVTDGYEDYELLYLGKGTRADYEGVDVEGKFILLEVDQINEWWYSYPTLEAQVQGAKGVIIAQSASYGEANPDTLNCNDSNSPKTSVALSISRNDFEILKDLIENSPNKKLDISLDVDSTITEEATTYNIIGEIPGETSEEIVVYSAHYDAYFSGFQDNGISVGLLFSIAKSMLDSGYKPKRTIVFTAVAAEEWGILNSRHDWAIGAYKQLIEAEPSWLDKAVININFELASYKHNEVSYINSSPELESFVEEIIPHIPIDTNVYPGGLKVYSPLSTWADDWVFYSLGVPSLRNDFTKSDFSKSFYHSQYDTQETHNEGVFTQNIITFGLIGMYAADSEIMNLDLSRSLKVYKDNLPDDRKELFKLVDRICTNYQNVVLDTSKKRELYKFFQESFLRLNWDDAQVFNYYEQERKRKKLENILDQLSDASDSRLIELAQEIDVNYCAGYFSPSVYNETLAQTQDEPAGRTWGSQKVVNVIDLQELIYPYFEEGILERETWQSVINKKLDELEEELDRIYAQDYKNFIKLEELMLAKA